MAGVEFTDKNGGWPTHADKLYQTRYWCRAEIASSQVHRFRRPIFDLWKFLIKRC